MHLLHQQIKYQLPYSEVKLGYDQHQMIKKDSKFLDLSQLSSSPSLNVEYYDTVLQF